MKGPSLSWDKVLVIELIILSSIPSFTLNIQYFMFGNIIKNLRYYKVKWEEFEKFYSSCVKMTAGWLQTAYSL